MSSTRRPTQPRSISKSTCTKLTVASCERLRRRWLGSTGRHSECARRASAPSRRPGWRPYPGRASAETARSSKPEQRCARAGMAEGNARKGCANGGEGRKNGQQLPRRLSLGRALYSTCHSLLQGVWPVVSRGPLHRSGLASLRRRITPLHRRCDVVDLSHPARFTPPRCEFRSAPHRPTSESDRSRVR